MKKLIESNYKSIVDRGLITPSTNCLDFLDKLHEEVKELELGVCIDFERDLISDYTKQELADVIMVCLNFANHFNIDIEQEILNKIEINKKRANDKGTTNNGK